MKSFSIIARVNADDLDGDYGTFDAVSARELMAYVLDNLGMFSIGDDVTQVTVYAADDFDWDEPSVTAFRDDDGWSTNEYDSDGNEAEFDVSRMLYVDARAVREEIVSGILPEWKKVEAHAWDTVPNMVPPTRGAKQYWKARNGSKNVMSALRNEQEELNAAHIEGLSTRTPGDAMLSVEQTHAMRCAMENYRQARRMCPTR
jgi:hypothetical protein